MQAALTAQGLTTARAGYLDTLNGLVTSIWSQTIEGSYTALQIVRLMASALLGKLSGAGTTTIAIRDTGDTKARITATVDEDGNRSAVTLDAS